MTRRPERDDWLLFLGFGLMLVVCLGALMVGCVVLT